MGYGGNRRGHIQCLWEIGSIRKQRLNSYFVMFNIMSLNVQYMSEDVIDVIIT